MRASKYTADLLGPIVRECTSFSDVIRRLGLPTTGGNYRNISSRIRYLGLDTSHFGTHTFAARCAALAVETLAPLVSQSTSMAQVLSALDMPTVGRAHHELKKRLRSLGIDTSHLLGAAWARGQTMATSPTIERIARRRRLPNEEVFIENSHVAPGRRVADKLVAMGRPYVCEWCGITEWRGKPLVLHLDHINGINNDHRVENLRFLCPNCHSQTETYGNRRRPPSCVV